MVNPGARKPDRRYAGEAFGRIVSVIASETGLRSLVVWGPGEEDLARTTVTGSKGAASLAPATDLDLLAALLRRTSLLVTNDTGPMHLGVACGSPVLALFTSDVANRWGHQLPTFKAIGTWQGAPDPVGEAQRTALELLAAGDGHQDVGSGH